MAAVLICSIETKVRTEPVGQSADKMAAVLICSTETKVRTVLHSASVFIHLDA